MLSAVAQRVEQIRQHLIKYDLDAFILPTADSHLGEYQPENTLRVTWLSGFHGENCVVVITRDKAGIFVDGRFTVQVKQQVPADVYDYLHMVNDCHLDWTMSQIPEGSRIAIDASLFSINWYQQAQSAFSASGHQLVSLEENPVDQVWEDRPAAPDAPVELFYNAGCTSQEKREKVAALLKEQQLDACLLTQPEDTNWLLNIRGCDIPYVRTVLSFGLLKNDSSLDLFIDTDRLPAGFSEHAGEGVQVHTMAKMADVLSRAVKTSPRIQLDPSQTNAWLSNLLTEAGAETVHSPGYCAKARVCKDETEIAGMKAAHIQDGIAMCRFLAWVDREVTTGVPHDEGTLADKLLEFREGVEGFVAPSFAWISALGPNAAMCHYHHDPDNARKLGQDGMYLIDSGGHYNSETGICGTTDITRTIKVGDVTDEQRHMATLVMKAHIALDTARFMPGTTGMQLDTVTRQPMWQNGVNFDHGTGHGIGHYISVHEFPPRISPKNTYGALEAGMCLTDEPGYYREDGYGIRLENVLVINKACNTEAELLEFETITFTPMDKRLFMTELFSDAEKEWLNSYHSRVYDKIAAHLNSEDREWLAQATCPIA